MIDDIRGLLLPASLSPQASAPASGPLPGLVSEASGQHSGMVLSTSGTIEGTTSPDIDLRALRAGMPGDAALIWRATGDDWQGWDAPHVPHDIRAVLRGTGAAYRPSSSIRTRSGAWIVSLVSDSQAVEVVCASGHVTVYDRGSAYSGGLPWSALCELPDGMVLLFAWIYHGTSWQIRAWRSDDDGGSWTLHQTSCLGGVIDGSIYTLGRLVAACLNGQICLIASAQEIATPEDRLIQWASSDDGASFVRVDLMTGQDRAWPQVIVSAGRLVVVYIARRNASAPHHLPYVRVLPSPYDLLSSVDSTAIDAGSIEWASQAGGVFDDGDLALSVDDDGAIYVIGRDTGSSMEIQALRSTDGGASWEGMGTSPSTYGLIFSGSTIYPVDLCLYPYHGALHLVHRWIGGGDTDGAYRLVLGGYSPVTLPMRSGVSDSPPEQAGWVSTWFPADLPDVLLPAVWSISTSGAPAITVNNSESMQVRATIALDDADWTATPASGLGNGITIEIGVTPGGLRPYVAARSSDGAGVSYSLRAAWNGSAWVVRDLHGGVDLGTVTPSGTRQRIVLAVGDGEGHVWILDESGVLDGEVDAPALVAGASATASASFGLSAVVTLSSAYFHHAHLADSTYTGTGLAGGQGRDSLSPRTVSGLPVWIASGLRLSAIDGPCGRGEEWSIKARYAYPVSNLDMTADLPRLSPRSPFKSPTAPILVWEYSSDVSKVERPLGVLGLYLSDVNWRYATIEGRNAAGAWVSLLSLDLAKAARGLGWIRTNSLMRSAGSGSSSPFYATGDLDGAYMVAHGSGRVWRISDQTAGKFIDPTTGVADQPVRFLVSDVVAGDATSGSDGAIIPREALVLLPATLSTSYSAYRLSVSSVDSAVADTSNPEADYRIGVAMLGYFHAFGMQYALGRAIEVAVNAEINEGRTGVLSAISPGPSYRSLEVSWSDPVDESVKSLVRAWEGGDIIATLGSTTQDIIGVIGRLNGSKPVVYLGAWPVGSNDSALLITSRRLLAYGLPQSESWRIDGVIGSEGRDEVWRGGTLRIRELI